MINSQNLKEGGCVGCHLWEFAVDSKLMAEIQETHQLRLVDFPIIYRVSYIPDFGLIVS